MIFWQAFMKESSSHSQTSDLIAAIEFHLSTMLSSEAPLVQVAKQYRHVKQSNLCFGLDNFQSVSGQMDDASFAHQVEFWIKQYERRLENIIVEMEPRDGKHNQINFSVQAQLTIEGRAQELAFSSQLNLTSQQAELEEQSFV